MTPLETIALNTLYFGGEGHPPLVILHGLLGSARNWRTVAGDLSSRFEVFAVDLRGHGDSPHHPDIDYDLMEADLLAWLDARRLEKVVLVGHSMGGKLAMRFACDHPDRVRALVVVDIAPKDYPAMRLEFDAMNAIDLAACASRPEVEERLGDWIRDWGMRKFLLTNLEREPDGGLHWRVDLPALTRALPGLSANPLSAYHHYAAGPVLFVRGERSDFIADADAEAIEYHFPGYAMAIIPDCGHNPHHEKRESFVRVLTDYFRERLA